MYDRTSLQHHCNNEVYADLLSVTVKELKLSAELYSERCKFKS